jgi:hypothetical protein
LEKLTTVNTENLDTPLPAVIPQTHFGPLHNHSARANNYYYSAWRRERS